MLTPSEHSMEWLGHQVHRALDEVGLLPENRDPESVLKTILELAGLGTDPDNAWFRLQARDLYLIAVGVCYGKGIEFDMDIFNGWLSQTKLPYALVNGPYPVTPNQRREPELLYVGVTWKT